MNDKAAQVDQTVETMSNIQSSIATINETISTLQAAAIKAERPWFKQPTLIISMVALLFSFGTTAVSYVRTKQQDINDARAELRGLILRLNQLPRENLELSKKYEADALTRGNLSGLINAENTIVAKQAAGVITRISGYVGATEYSNVAYALSQSGLADEALRLERRALNRVHIRRL